MQQLKTLLICILVLVLPALMIYLFIEYQQLDAPSENRDFSKIPYDITDAAKACTDKTDKQYGNKLLRSYVDWHSTRKESGRGIYLVVVQADIGKHVDPQSVSVYCYINLSRNELSSYRVYTTDKDPLLEVGFSMNDLFDSLKNR